MEEKFDVSIIIVNYNTYDLVVNCIKSIEKFVREISYEVIVVDNDSANREIENLISIFPKVKLINNERNAGFGAGNNLGVRHSFGKYLFFLNSDTLLINNAVKVLFDCCELNPKIGVCGGNLFNLDMTPNISFERLKPSIFNGLDSLFFSFFKRKKFKKNIYFNSTNDILRISGYVSGANFFVKKDIFNKVGGFDEDFFMYYEEVELTFRINKLNLHSYVTPQAKIVHLEGGSQSNISEKKIKWMDQSLDTYAIKTNIKFKRLFKFIYKLLYLKNLILSKLMK